MAYVPEQEDEEKKLTGGAGSQPSFVGGSGASGQMAGADKFVNVNDYLSKNPNEGAKTGDLAAKKITDATGEASQAVTGANDAFNQAVGQNTVNFDQNIFNSAMGSPTDFVKDPNNLARFQSMRDAAYGGPMDLQSTAGYSGTQSKVQKATGLAGLADTESGRNQLVGDLSKKPTAGKTALTQLFLQGSPDAAQKLQSAGQGAKSVEQQWSDYQTAAPGAAQAAKATTDATKAQTGQGLQTGVQSFQKGLDDRYATAAKQREDYNASVLDNQRSLYDINNVTDSFKRTAGIDFQNPFSSYVNAQQMTSPVTKEQVATEDDFAKQAALAQLAGYDLNALNPALSGQAGTFQAPAYVEKANAQQLADQAAKNAYKAQQATPRERQVDVSSQAGRYYDALDPYSTRINPTTYGVSMPKTVLSPELLNEIWEEMRNEVPRRGI